jgi:pectate lyase
MTSARRTGPTVVIIIGPNQSEGVHCQGSCTVTNVWWDAVCEDAFSIKEQADGETTTINGGGAKGAEDKVIQHNGGGTVVIQDFTVSDFGKLYRSCGNCDEMPARHVQVTGGSATNGDILVGINPNMGDTASISGVSSSGVAEECVAFEGVTDGSEPTKVGACDGTGSGTGSGSAASSVASATTSATEDTTTSAADDATTSAASTATSSAASDATPSAPASDDDEGDDSADEDEDSGADDN